MTPVFHRGDRAFCFWANGRSDVIAGNLYCVHHVLTLENCELLWLSNDECQAVPAKWFRPVVAECDRTLRPDDRFWREREDI